MIIGKETVTCGGCGREYEELVIGGHISQPILCESCILDILTGKPNTELTPND